MKINTRSMLSEMASESCLLEATGSTLDEADRLAEEFKSTYRKKVEALGYYLDAEPMVKSINGAMLCHSIEAILYPMESLANPDENEAVRSAGNELPEIFKEKPVVISYSPLTAVYWLRSMR